MITKDKRLLGTVAGAMILAAVTGFGVARCTADPAAAPAAEGEKEAASEALPSSLAITPEAIVALGGPPKCPAWDEHHLYAVVLLYETGDALTTFQRNWEACVHIFGEELSWKWNGLVMTPKGVRPREGAKPRKPGLRWAVAELGRAYQGITVRDARVAQSAEESAGMGQELPLIAALHPRWATSLNGKTIPFVDAPDLEIAPDGEGKFYCAPCLHFDRDRGLGLGRVGLGACNVGNPNRGFGSGSLQ